MTHVSGELSTLRNRIKRQSLALASGAGIESRLEEAEKRYEGAQELADSETRKLREEMRRRVRLEARIGRCMRADPCLGANFRTEELETQLALRTKEVEDAKGARSRDAQDLLSNAKGRLAAIHQEVGSSSFRIDC